MSRLADEWTLLRLAILKRYLCAFTTAWKDRSVTTAYIDAFGGANYCIDDLGDSSALAGFPALADASLQALLKQSARTALSTDPPFDGYVFIERNRRRCHVLEALRHEFPQRNIQIRRVEANRELRRISHLNWHKRRAVLFVDAYAANLEWNTINAVSRSNAIDMWLLFPVGIGSDPLATSATTPPPYWRARLQALLHTDKWTRDFEAAPPTLDRLVEVLSPFVRDRLTAAFATVSSPRVMRSSSGAPLYLLCFASSAPGIDGHVAVELADHLLESAAADRV